LAIAACLVGILLLAVPASALGAGDANMSSCPQSTEESPGFRTYLPDCRAYELVTPSQNGGYAVKGELFHDSAYAPAAASGDRVLGMTLGSFGGSEYSYVGFGQLGIPYTFGRQAGGWATSPLMPKASQLPSPTFLDVDSDLEQSLWKSGDSPRFLESTAPEDVYLRTPAGQFVEIGPATPSIPAGENEQASYVGASADLKRIGLEYLRVAGIQESNPLWPGDDTVQPTEGESRSFSLYEYDRTGASEPSLVGVRNDESLEAAATRLGKAHINEAAEQISTCGIELGSGYEKNRYNAISPSGFGVFFTAIADRCGEAGSGPPVDELYVRIGGTHTLALSEPPLNLPGRDCTDVCAESQREENGHARAAAAFAGASEDGRRVYFTTSQPLVNADQDESSDLYMEELDESRVTRIVYVSGGGSGDPTPGEGAAVLGVPRVSEDGNRVYFVAEGTLTSQPNANGEAAAPGQKNLYTYGLESQTTDFVAGLAEADEGLWTTSPAEFAQTSAPDGRYFIFLSTAHLSGTGDTSGNGENIRQLFEYGALAKTVRRVSIGQEGQFLCPATGLVESGYNCNGNIELPALAPSIKGQSAYRYASPAAAPHTELNVTSDGIVFFESRNALTPGAANGYPDFQPGMPNIYEYRDGNVFLISDGVETPTIQTATRVTSKTLFLTATDDGGAIFTTADPLVPQDGDTQAGIYDAHVNGGYPAPLAAEDCAGASCRTAGSSEDTGSAVGTGSAQTAESARKATGHRRKHHHRKGHHRKKGHGKKSRAENLGARSGRGVEA
jgi:hypothetical protein